MTLNSCAKGAVVQTQITPKIGHDNRIMPRTLIYLTNLPYTDLIAPDYLQFLSHICGLPLL